MPFFLPYPPIGFRGLPGRGESRGGRAPGSAGDDPWDFSGAAFPNIDELEIEATTKDRAADASKISQKGSSLCGPCSFLFCLASRHPNLYETFIRDLYRDGTARIGSFEIAPGEDCRNYNPGGKIAAADWVGLASIRDSENAIFDYDEVEDQFAGITVPDELEAWFKDCRLYSEVEEDASVFVTQDVDNFNDAFKKFRAGWNVAILIHADVIQQPAFDRNPVSQAFSIPNHWVTLTRDVAPAAGKPGEFSFAVYSWGERYWPVPGVGSMKMSQFLKNYYGYVACR